MNDELRLKIFTDNYLECAGWADMQEDNDPLLAEASYSGELLSEAKTDCKAFLEVVGDKLPDDLLSQAGHDFWLTRNGHGTGFWDRPEIYGQEVADFFDSLCGWRKQFDQVNPCVGDDNLVYFS